MEQARAFNRAIGAVAESQTSSAWPKGFSTTDRQSGGRAEAGCATCTMPCLVPCRCVAMWPVALEPLRTYLGIHGFANAVQSKSAQDELACQKCDDQPRQYLHRAQRAQAAGTGREPHERPFPQTDRGDSDNKRHGRRTKRHRDCARDTRACDAHAPGQDQKEQSASAGTDGDRGDHGDRVAQRPDRCCLLEGRTMRMAAGRADVARLVMMVVVIVMMMVVVIMMVLLAVG